MELLTHISNIAYFSPHFPISVGKRTIYTPDFTTLPHEVRPLHLNHSDFITEIIPPQQVRPETNAHKSTTFLYFHPQTTPLHPTKTFFFREFSQDMLLRVPSFYNKFCCLADKCTDTCCVGWEIDVDEISLSKYRDLAENTSPKCERDEKKIAFAKILMENIQDGHFILKPGDRCPFLMKNGLCEMICKLGCNGSDLDESGENVLCDICREHPRFVEVYGDIMEKGVGLCCEEAVRLLLTSDSQDDSTICHSELYETKNFSSQVELCPLGRSTKCEVEESSNVLNLVKSEIDEEPDEMPEGAEEARDAIFAEREHIFELLANKSKPLNQRLIEILDYVENTNANDKENSDLLSDAATKQTWIEILGEGESFGPAWDKAFERIIRKGWDQSQDLFSEEDGEKIVAYLIFRYYAKSLFDGDAITKVQFAIFFWIILQHFGMELSAEVPEGAADLTRKINAVKLLSKQTEYSEEIMEILTDNFYQNEAFCTEQFRSILSP